MYERAGGCLVTNYSDLERRTLLISLLLTLAMPKYLHAEQQNPLLRVNGSSGTVEFDRAALEALPQVTFRNSTVWTTEVQEFSGRSLASVLQAAEATSELIVLHAVNAYTVEIPSEEISERFPVIAHRINGVPFSRRDKGPLWLVYPYDQSPDYRNEVTYARCIWQLVAISTAPD